MPAEIAVEDEFIVVLRPVGEVELLAAVHDAGPDFVDELEVFSASELDPEAIELDAVMVSAPEDKVSVEIV